MQVRRRAILLSSMAAVAVAGAVLFFQLDNIRGGSGSAQSGDTSCASTNLPPGVSAKALQAEDPCYRFEGHRISKALSFCIDTAGRSLERPLPGYSQKALDTWKLDSGLDLPVNLDGGDCPGLQAKLQGGLNVIAWGPLPGEELGLTKLQYRRGVIDEAVITLETSPARLPESCLETVSLHEFGHVLGLEHQSDPDSIMQPVTDCPDNPVLSPRDIAAVRLLYGPS